MGGRDSNRGYLLQTIIAVLTVLENQNCQSISIEPDDEDEKVDIKWYDEQQNLSVIQVKSSINNFEKTQALNYLAQLIDGSPNAQAYNLTLIGNFLAETTKFFNHLKNAKQEEFKDKHACIYPMRNQITTDLKALDLKAYEGHTQSLIHSFLSNKGYLAHHQIIELIAKAFSYQFSRFATEGKLISKATLEAQIIEWMQYNHPKEISSRVQCLNLIFYSGGGEIPDKQMTDQLRLSDISEWKYTKKQIRKLEKLYTEIQAIDLPVRSTGDKSISPIQNAISGIFKQEPHQPAGCTDADINNISSLCKKYLNLSPEPSLFRVGNLQQTAKGGILWAVHTGPTYVGTETEKQKQDLLDDLDYGLRAIDDLFKWWDKLKAYRIIPLVLQNEGDELNQEIDLQISLPKAVKLLNRNDFPLPDYQVNLEKLVELGGLVESAFVHHNDTNVNTYNSRFIRPVDFKMPNILGSRTEDSKEYFSAIINYLFDYQPISGPSDQTTFTCSFRSIKPGEKISLPAYLFVKHDEPFKISYQIRSNQCKGITGELEVS